MRKFFIVLSLSLFGLSLVLAAPSKNISKAPVKVSKLYKPRVEPSNSDYTPHNSGVETSPYQYNYNRNFSATMVDNSKNGYGMNNGGYVVLHTLAKILDVPFAIVDATSITEAGYVGEDVENILLRLIQAADYDISKAEHGII